MTEYTWYLHVLNMPRTPPRQKKGLTISKGTSLLATTWLWGKEKLQIANEGVKMMGSKAIGQALLKFGQSDQSNKLTIEIYGIHLPLEAASPFSWNSYFWL